MRDIGLLEEIEDRTLGMLQSSQTQILDDESLVLTLRESKETFLVLKQKLHDSQVGWFVCS